MEPQESPLQAWHISALQWFADHAGQEFARRPFDVGLSVKLTSLQKGIWKPASTAYALSVVQTHKGSYPDLPPEYATDGTWMYLYHQEGSAREDLADPGRRFANAALFRCWRDRVPVGVIIPGSTGQYLVLGLALVENYASGYFVLSGPAQVTGELPHAGDSLASSISLALVDLPPLNLEQEEDGRQRVIAEVVRRQGQPAFRRLLLQAYEGRCAMSEYDAEPALEAAHIVPFRGPQTNHPANGLLLRADLHDLFDLGLIAIETDGMRIALAADLDGTMYERLAGHRLHMPRDPRCRPSMEALDRHRMQSMVAV